jgi:hypothetical protein
MLVRGACALQRYRRFRRNMPAGRMAAQQRIDCSIARRALKRE